MPQELKTPHHSEFTANNELTND